MRTFLKISNLLDPDVWELRLDILTFTYVAMDLLRKPTIYDHDSVLSFSSEPPSPEEKEPTDQASLQGFLLERNFSDKFLQRYLAPLISILWGLGDMERIKQLPAETIIRYLWDHGILTAQYPWANWATLDRGVNFRDVIKNMFAENIYTDTPIVSITPDPTNRSFILRKRNGRKVQFDHVILAMPALEALGLLSQSATLDERLILSGFLESRAIAVIHPEDTVSCFTLL